MSATPLLASMGKTRIQNPTKSQNQMYQAYLKNLPGIVDTTNQQQTPTAQAQLAAAQATLPGYNQLSLEQLQQFGLPMAQTGQNIAASNAMAGAESNLNLLRGPGGQTAREAMALSREVNPNYWNVQDASSRQATNLLNSINLAGLSPGEAAAVERSLGQTNSATGNLGLINPMNTINNAINFGGAYNNKLGILGGALGAANNTAATAIGSGVNPVGLALGTSQTNTGTSFQNPTMGGTVNPTNPTTNLALGQDYLGVLGGLANTNLTAQQKIDYANSIQGWASSFGANNVFAGGSGGGASSCCFIFLECLNGTLPWWVRECRDEYYSKEPKMAEGYKKMARWLVPWMKRNVLVKGAVNTLMVKPITKYGGWLKKVPHHNMNWIYRPFKSFWFTIWRLYA